MSFIIQGDKIKMIKLYTIDCPKCKVLEMKLDQKNIEYEKLHPPVIYDKNKFKTKNSNKAMPIESDKEIIDIDWVWANE